MNKVNIVVTLNIADRIYECVDDMTTAYTGPSPKKTTKLNINKLSEHKVLRENKVNKGNIIVTKMSHLIDIKSKS